MNRSQNPGGHKEERASFPIKSQYKNLNNPYLYFLERRGRKKRKGNTGERRAPGKVAAAVCAPGKKRRERKRGAEGGI